jgi:membrane-bound serine protease (ClpP class)
MVMMAVIRMRKMPISMGVEAMIGERATARSYLNPEGFVFIRGERWKAVAEDAPISEGTPVEVTAVKGLTLSVRRPAGEPASEPG